jgi:putative cell wall-binding protein
MAALVVATATSGLLFPTAAGALPAVAADLTLDGDLTPTIAVGKTNQAVAPLDLTVTVGDTLSAGDQIRIFLDDSDGSTCAGGDTLSFTALPTVTVTGTATILSSLETSGGTCVNDVLRLNVTGSGSAAVAITGIAYSVGAGAEIGEVAVTSTFNGGASPAGTTTNAFISTVLPSGNNPPLGAMSVTGGSYVISPIVVAEQAVDAADLDVCLYPINGTLEDVPAPAPTVAVTGGSDTAAVTADTVNNSLLLDVTPSGPTSTSTFTISNVRVETDPLGGVVRMRIKAADDGTCDNSGGETLLTGEDTTIGFHAEVERFGGADRFSTAQILFEEGFSCADDVIIARADQFPDALAASYLAGQMGTGILLTNTNSVPAATFNALRNEGVNNVFLMGGTAAISAAVATQLDGTAAFDCGGGPEVPAATLTVQRIAGANRYETAELAAEFAGLGSAGDLDITPTDGIANAAPTAILTSGENFPDALAAGPLAFRGDNALGESLPLLLSQPGSVPPATLAGLINLGIVHVVVVGGTAAVSDAAVAQLTAAGYEVRRIAGTSRQATAVALATAMTTEWDYDPDDAVMGRGDDFADALAGGPFAGSSTGGHAPAAILLTGGPTSLSTTTAAFLSAWEAVIGQEWDELDVFGGTGAVSAAVVQAALDAGSLQTG